MCQYDLLLLHIQIRQKELLQISDQERLFRIALKNQLNRRSTKLRITDCIRGRLPVDRSRLRNTCVQDRALISSVSR